MCCMEAGNAEPSEGRASCEAVRLHRALLRFYFKPFNVQRSRVVPHTAEAVEAAPLTAKMCVLRAERGSARLWNSRKLCGRKEFPETFSSWRLSCRSDHVSSCFCYQVQL